VLVEPSFLFAIGMIVFLVSCPARNYKLAGQRKGRSFLWNILSEILISLNYEKLII